MILESSSEQKLVGVHPDLVRVIRRAALASTIGFRVIEGVRTLARQKQLKAAGASRTLNSRHLKAGPSQVSHAVDVVPMLNGKISWDWPLYHKLAPIIKAAARAEKVPLEWGGDWRTFRDGPHWQLPFGSYPK
jgi:peptidoglycan L-alanyl-D-glutamate endopeptidase CwlK